MVQCPTDMPTIVVAFVYAVLILAAACTLIKAVWEIIKWEINR